VIPVAAPSPIDPQPELWRRVSHVVSRTASVEALRHHGVHLMAAADRHARGLPVADDLHADELRAALLTLSAPTLLRRVRSAYDGRLLLIKGPELAACYPRPQLRPFIDLDLLTDDPGAAHCALRSAGFIEVGVSAAYTGAHHLRPLAWPQLPLTIELHRTLNHPSWLAPPPSRELLELTRPSATGVDGLLGLLPAAHAIVIALHSWAHQPLRRLLDLVDIMMVLEPSDRAEAGRLARRWGSHRVWRTTLSAAVSLLEEGSRAFTLSTWARHLAEVRERTVLETHLARWAGAGSGLPRTGLRSIGGATVLFTDAMRPRSGESWSDALGRTRLAMSNAFRPQSEHDDMKLRSE
jgi:hypothetical protein